MQSSSYAFGSGQLRPASEPARWPSFVGRVLAATALVVLGTAVTLRAQETPPPASQPAEGGLDVPYVDGSFGFSIQPPTGCTLFREKQIGDADVEIARFVKLVNQWSLAVRLSTTTQDLDTKTIIDGITRRLTAQHESLKVMRADPAQIAGREGVRYAATFTAENTDWLRQQAVVGVRPKEYFTLVFITPANHQAVAESMFDQIVASFQMVRDERTQERVNKALERGTRILQQAARGEPGVTARIFDDNFFRFIVGGKDIGYVRVSERVSTIDHRKGLQVREWGWLFDESGTITHLQHDMFLSADMSFERWENRLYVIPPAKDGAQRQLVVDIENAVRQDDQLGVAYMPRPNSQEKKDKVIQVEKSYASAAWNVLFPRMVDLTQPELYAFSNYKSERRGLVLRTLEVVGPAKIFINGQQTPVIRLEDSEGLVPPKSEVFVDGTGKMLRVVADKLEMVSTTQQYIERHFGAKVAEAQNLLKSLQPQRPAVPKPAEEQKRPK